MTSTLTNEQRNKILTSSWLRPVTSLIQLMMFAQYGLLFGIIQKEHIDISHQKSMKNSKFLNLLKYVHFLYTFFTPNIVIAIYHTLLLSIIKTLKVLELKNFAFVFFLLCIEILSLFSQLLCFVA